MIVLLIICIINIYTEEYNLKHNIPDTISLDYVIVDNSLLLKSGNYILKNNVDYIFSKGKIILLNKYDSLQIHYKLFEPKLKYTYKKYSIDAYNKYNENDTIFNINRELNSNIYFSGYKGFLVDINDYGNTQFNQSLNIDIQGKISDTWSIKGLIYDDTYQSNIYNNYNIALNQIDNINMSLYDSTTIFSFGNNVFKGYNGKFNNKNREILGIYISKLYRDYSYKVAIAGQKGVFKSTHFFCQDGVQGPYKLIDNMLLAEYIITPESDIVYLNGELLERGEDKDYTIDYQKGEIVFTINRIVDNNSFVYAEFQTIENNNPLTGYYLSAGGDSTKLKFLFIREEQSVIDENAIEIIKNIDYDTNSIFLPYIEYVGENNGDYIFVDSFYQYDSNMGDYSIEFFYVGYNKGDYVYNPIDNSFVYAGKNRGNYMPGRYIDLPYESDYFSLELNQNLFNGLITLETGGGLYNYNRYNTQSEYIKDISYSIKYNTDIKVSDILTNFLIEHTYISPFYRRVWNKADNGIKDIYKTNILNGFENINTFSMYSKYKNIIDFKFDYKIKDSIIGRIVNIKLYSVFDINYIRDYESMNNNIIYHRDYFNIEKKIHYINVMYSYNREIKLQSIYNHSIGFNLFNHNYLIFSKERTYFENKLNKEIFSIKNRFDFTFLHNSTYINGEFRRIYYNNILNNKLYVSFNANSMNREYFDYSININITSLSSFKEIESYIYVGKGRGDYVFDSLSNNYYYDEYEGMYIKIIENIPSDIPLSSRSSIYNFNFEKNNILISMEGNYNDNAQSIYAYKSTYIETRTVLNNIKMHYKISNMFIPFYENYYTSNNKLIDYYYNNIENKIGIFSINKDFNYRVFVFSNKNTAKREYSKEEFLINGVNINSSISNMPFYYNFSFIFNNINGLYYDNYTDSIYPYIKFSSIEFDIKYYFNNTFYIGISPSIRMGVYLTLLDIPNAIYYRYPEGMSYKGNIYVNWSNEIINLNIRYISEFDNRNLYRHKVNMSFYTYF